MKKNIILFFIFYFNSVYCLSSLYNEQMCLTFDDVLLVPSYSCVLPRETFLHTKLTANINLKIPIISAAMDTVTEADLAIALAKEGGIGIIHKNMSVEDQAMHVEKVKRAESYIIKDPITIAPSATISELLSLTTAHNISGVPVVENNKLVGIVTSRDIRFEKNLLKTISQVMTPKELLITVQEHTHLDEILALLHHRRIEKIPVVDQQFKLCGMITAKDIQLAKDKPNACKDLNGQLRVGAAVGVDDTSKERVKALANVNVDVIVVDSAHGHSKGVIESKTHLFIIK